MVESRSDQQIGYILRSYPRLSQTFILNEILGLERLGIRLEIFALSLSGEELVQPASHQVRARVRYLDSAHRKRYLLRAFSSLILSKPGRFLAALSYTEKHPEFSQGYTNSSRTEAFRQAVALAHLMLREKRIPRLHAHFAHDPALVALLTHKLTGIPFSFTAHARDLYQIPVGSLREKVRHASSVITCCQANRHYLLENLPPADHSKIHLVHHGVDLDAFHEGDSEEHKENTALIISAGRLVEKKGFADLISALALIDCNRTPFCCHIYGDGPLRASLQELITRYGLEKRVEIKGAYTQNELASSLRQANIFALTPFPVDGDRDGLPNVLVEAMAAGLPVVSTSVSGIPDLVRPAQNGLLFPPGDIYGISAGIQTLLGDKSLRARMGKAARQAVETSFDQRAASIRLADIFQMGGS